MREWTHDITQQTLLVGIDDPHAVCSSVWHTLALIAFDNFFPTIEAFLTEWNWDVHIPVPLVGSDVAPKVILFETDT